MKTYIVNNEEYVTICSVHDKILTLLDSPCVNNEIKILKELVNVAKTMGQNMEDAIKYKNIVTCGTIDFYNFQRYMNNETEED